MNILPPSPWVVRALTRCRFHSADNIIADYGAEELARMLNRNHTLRTLNLYGVR